MSAKQVWAIISIVVGITLVFKGLAGNSAASFYGDEIESMNLLMKKHDSAFANEVFNIKHSRNVIGNSKATQLFIIALGIKSAAIGTSMLRKKDIRETEDGFSDIDELESNNSKWRM